MAYVLDSNLVIPYLDDDPVTVLEQGLQLVMRNLADDEDIPELSLCR